MWFYTAVKRRGRMGRTHERMDVVTMGAMVAFRATIAFGVWAVPTVHGTPGGTIGRSL